MERTLYVNGVIFGSRSGALPADTLLVHGDRIEAVGAAEDIVPLAHGARREDLAGCCVLPGFNDSHAHLLSFGLTLLQLDVSADAVRTVADICAAVADRTRTTGPNNWVHGRGYNHNELDEHQHVTAGELDAVSGGHPVVLDHTSGHALVCNSEALRRAGVSRNTADPPGGRIARDADGEPTGLLEETAMNLLRGSLPRTSEEEGCDAILAGMRVLSSFGITSASDAWTGGVVSLDAECAMYRSAASSGRLTVRITLMPLLALLAADAGERFPTTSSIDVGATPRWLTCGATKIFSDGALSTRTAAMRSPYADDPSNTGVLFWKSDELTTAMQPAHDAGWQIATHALGDRAVELVLECYERVIRNNPRPNHRHRVEHCMYADEGLVAKFATLCIVPSLQPDIYRLGDAYVSALGLARASQSIPTGLFRKYGVEMAFSSDLPVIPGRPLDVIRSSIERTTPSGTLLGAEHAVSVVDAIHAYTWGGAYATHTEDTKGTLAPGMMADFVTLSGDPLTLPTEEWDTMEVVKTVAGGRETYTQ